MNNAVNNNQEQVISSNILVTDETILNETTYQTINSFCARYFYNLNSSETFEIDHTCLVLTNQNSMQTTCQCNTLGSFILVEQVTLKKQIITKTNIRNIPTAVSNPQNNTETVILDQYLNMKIEAILIPILGVACVIILVGLLFVVGYIIYQKRTNGYVKNSFELKYISN